MNIQSLLEKISLFDQLVVDSGFERDVSEATQAVTKPEIQSSLQALKDITRQIKGTLEHIHSTDLPESLIVLLPKKQVFTDQDFVVQLQDLLDDPSIDTATYFTKLQDVLKQLNSLIAANKQDLQTLKNTFQQYVIDEAAYEAEAEEAIISLVFRDTPTVTSLPTFANKLLRWNRALFLYHQLVTSESPKKIQLVEVQNGSIDVIVNVDIKVAVDLVELIKVGMIAFGLYLNYKSGMVEAFKDYLSGNKEWSQLEQKQEKILLENISEAVLKKLEEQHKVRKKKDRKINNESIDVKVSSIAKTVTDHIVRGNEVRLLSAGQPEDGGDDEEQSVEEEARQLKDKSFEVKKLLNELSKEEVKLLLDKYEIEEDDTVSE